MVEPLYQVKIACDFCEITFSTSRVRSSFQKSSGRDTDFYIHYKEWNPNYYVVRICPNCGYASTENATKTFMKSQRIKFSERVASQWSGRDYGGERSWSDALEAFKLALLTAQIRNENVKVVSGLLHHIAWLHRAKDDVEEEMKFLHHALHAYIQVYETEEFDPRNVRVMYLIGELHRRLGEYNEAVKWFARVVNDKKIVDSAMIRACREQWMSLREQMQEEAQNSASEASQ